MSRRIWGSLGVMVVVAVVMAGCGSPARTATRALTSSTAPARATINPGGPMTVSDAATAPAATTTTASATQTTPATDVAAIAAGFARLGPSAIFADSVRALASARSFQAAGTETRSGRSTDVRLVYQQPFHVEAQVRRGDAAASIIATPFAAYIYANVVFAERRFGGLTADEAQDLANRWLELDGRLGASESRPLLRFSPRQLSACLTASFPSPSLAGTTSVAGRPAVILHSSSTRAGAADLVVSALAPHYPVRFTRLRARTTANQDDPCEQSAGGIGKIGFSDWNMATVTLPLDTTILP